MLKPRQSDPEHCLLTTLPAGHWSGMERHKDGLIVASDPLDLTSSLPKEACNQKQLKVSFWCLCFNWEKDPMGSSARGKVHKGFFKDGRAKPTHEALRSPNPESGPPQIQAPLLSPRRTHEKRPLQLHTWGCPPVLPENKTIDRTLIERRLRPQQWTCVARGIRGASRETEADRGSLIYPKSQR